MRLGISLPINDANGGALDVAGVMARARLIEDAGFDNIWMGDTFGPGVTRPDPLMWLLAAAASTTRVELGTAILQLPLRNPVELAQRVMTLQSLSGGRFTLGVGAGSQRSHAAIGADYEKRFPHLREYIETIRKLCEGERVGNAYLNPWPEVSHRPRVLIGTWASGVWLRRAARDYDGWIASASKGLGALAEGIKRYREAGGKRALVADLQIDLAAANQSLTNDEPFTLVCSSEAAAERLRRLSDLGFDDALLMKADHTRELNRYESDFTTDDLHSYRALPPR